MTKDKKFIIVGLIKNYTQDGYLIAHFERVAEEHEVKEVNKNFEVRQSLGEK